MSTRRRGQSSASNDGTEDDASEAINRWTFQEISNESPDDDAESPGSFPLTVKLTDIISPDQQEEYLEWQRGITRAMETTVGPSCVSSILLREVLDSSSAREQRVRFVVLFRFADRESAAAWHASEERKVWLRKLLMTGFGKSSTENSSISSSDAFPMFDMADLEEKQHRKRQRWRTAFLVWLQVFALVEVFGVIMPAVVGHVRWSSLSLHLKIALSTALTTLTIEGVTMRIFVGVARALGFLGTEL